MRENVNAPAGVSGYDTATRSRGDNSLTKRPTASRTRTLFVAADVIIVEEDRKQPVLIVGGFALLILDGEDLPERRPVAAVVDLDELEGFDLLDLVAFANFEIRGGEVGDRLAGAVEDDDVDADGVDARPEGRLLRRILRRAFLRQHGDRQQQRQQHDRARRSSTHVDTRVRCQ